MQKERAPSLKRRIYIYLIFLFVGVSLTGLEFALEFGSTSFESKVMAAIKSGNPDKPFNHLRTKILILIILDIFTVGVIFFMFVKDIISPLSYIAKQTKKISEGNLNEYIDLESEDELGQVATLINTLTTNLQELVNYLNNIGKTLENVNTTIAEIVQNNSLPENIKGSLGKTSKKLKRLARGISTITENFKLFRIEL